jgi:hypothetical protein
MKIIYKNNEEFSDFYLFKKFILRFKNNIWLIIWLNLEFLGF